MREGNSRLGLLGSARRLRILGFDDQPARRAGDGLRRPHLARCAQMQVEDKLVTLTPGMAVTAEIKTGSRTVLSYLLSPLMRYRHGSLRER
jgi:hypothetical protein